MYLIFIAKKKNLKNKQTDTKKVMFILKLKVFISNAFYLCKQ